MTHGDAIQAMLVSVPPEDLAVALMPAFEDNGDLTESKLIRWLCARFPGLDADRHWLDAPVREALQVLEHAELIYVSRMWNAPPYFRATRLGLLALEEELENGEASVRRCVEERIATSTATPPRQPAAQRLQELETLRATGAISDAEYARKRDQIIDDI